MWSDLIDGFAKGFASAVEDVRRRVVETGWFGSPVTNRTSTITIGTAEKKSPGEQLGWDWPGASRAQEYGREPAAIERHGPERGIDR